MIHVHKVYFFTLVTLWLNSAVASEYRPQYPVPRYNQTNQSSDKGFIVLPNISHFHLHLPNFGKLFENVDFSGVTETVQEHKMMFGIATSVIFLSLLVKQLQKSETWKQSLQERYVATEKSIDDCTNSCINQCPMPVRLAITPIKILFQFLCKAIKKYVAMNNGTIVYSVVAPVTGRLLDSVVGCPIPLLNFTSIGGMVSGVVLTKGYFDSNFEQVNERFDGIEGKINQVDTKNMQQHNLTQQQVGMVQQTINGVSDRVSNLFERIKNLDTGVGQIKDQVGVVSEQVKDILKSLVGTEKQVAALHDKIDLRDKEAVKQYEDLKKRLENVEGLLQKKIEHNESLMLELKGFKDIYQNDLEALRKDLGATSSHLSLQIDGVKKEVQEGFASQNRRNKCLNSSDHKDTQILMLQSQLEQQFANKY